MHTLENHFPIRTCHIKHPFIAQHIRSVNLGERSHIVVESGRVKRSVGLEYESGDFVIMACMMMVVTAFAMIVIMISALAVIIVIMMIMVVAAAGAAVFMMVMVFSHFMSFF